jgi:hypothetical protein
MKPLILATLTQTPNLTAKELAQLLDHPDASVYGLISSLIRSKSIYVSGEVLVGKCYMPRYAVGATGPFTMAPERFEKKKRRSHSAEALALKPVVKRVLKTDIARRLRHVSDCPPVTTPRQDWMSILTDDYEPPVLTITQQRQIVKNNTVIIQPPQLSAWDIEGRDLLTT